MHESGVVHRDIKPENVVFYSTKTDIVKIIDFGTATDIDRANKEKLSEHFGSPYYIAPEVVKGEYNHMCDIWSAGIIMFTMLMRRVPFDGALDSEVIEKVVNTNINFHHKEFSVKSIESVDLLKKMLFKDYNARISGYEAVKHKWIVTYAIVSEDKQDIKTALKMFRLYINKGPL